MRRDGVRAMAAARRADMRRGDNQHSPIGGTSQAEAAERFGVRGPDYHRDNPVLSSVERARTVGLAHHGNDPNPQAATRG
jgi:hypothetical protein